MEPVKPSVVRATLAHHGVKWLLGLKRISAAWRGLRHVDTMKGLQFVFSVVRLTGQVGYRQLHPRGLMILGLE